MLTEANEAFPSRADAVLVSAESASVLLADGFTFGSDSTFSGSGGFSGLSVFFSSAAGFFAAAATDGWSCFRSSTKASQAPATRTSRPSTPTTRYICCWLRLACPADSPCRAWCPAVEPTTGAIGGAMDGNDSTGAGAARGTGAGARPAPAPVGAGGGVATGLLETGFFLGADVGGAAADLAPAAGADAGDAAAGGRAAGRGISARRALVPSGRDSSAGNSPGMSVAESQVALDCGRTKWSLVSCPPRARFCNCSLVKGPYSCSPTNQYHCAVMGLLPGS